MLQPTYDRDSLTSKKISEGNFCFLLFFKIILHFLAERMTILDQFD